jgi:hypothetical protein
MSTGEGIASIGAGIGDIFASKGHKQAAKLYDRAAGYSKQAAGLEAVSADIAVMQAERTVYKTIGAQSAALGASGLESSFDLLADSQSQGALTTALLRAQGEVNVLGKQAAQAGYEIQAAQERAMAKSSLIGGIFKIIGGVTQVAASDRRLKEDIVHIGEWPNGLPMYEFRYKGEKQFWRGVMADDVEAVFPQHVYTMPDGYKAVDYSALGIRLEKV